MRGWIFDSVQIPKLIGVDNSGSSHKWQYICAYTVLVGEGEAIFTVTSNRRNDCNEKRGTGRKAQNSSLQEGTGDAVPF